MVLSLNGFRSQPALALKMSNARERQIWLIGAAHMLACLRSAGSVHLDIGEVAR